MQIKQIEKNAEEAIKAIYCKLKNDLSNLALIFVFIILCGLRFSFIPCVICKK